MEIHPVTYRVEGQSGSRLSLMRMARVAGVLKDAVTSCMKRAFDGTWACMANGFTLFELLLVIVILGLSTALVSPAVMSGLSSARHRSVARMLAATLKNARELSVSDGKPYAVKFYKDRLTVSAGFGGAGIVRREVKTDQENRIICAEKEVLLFYPGGDSSGGVFEVRNNRSKIAYIVKVERMSGRVLLTEQANETRDL
ncbi:MAG: prepilin-type N-terminal cleavage/methylation domain-containing protein [Deltaproteobacteria bacterium]|nr:prepilin-type N-terminal cleavage/methylation domain-containing protein [Deltaproteobacteria bacterium]